jgi:hypothetical protein
MTYMTNMTYMAYMTNIYIDVNSKYRVIGAPFRGLTFSLLYLFGEHDQKGLLCSTNMYL